MWYFIRIYGQAVLYFLVLTACDKKQDTSEKIARYAAVTELKADKIAYYKEIHANAWPSVLAKIKECHIRNYSIYLKKIGTQYYLFSYFEYTGDHFDADMQKMAVDPETRRWWKETDPCQIPLPDAAAKGKIWSEMEEVFHTD